VRDLLARGRPVTLVWSKRLWRCAEQQCPMGSWSQTHPPDRAAGGADRTGPAVGVRTGRPVQTVDGGGGRRVGGGLVDGVERGRGVRNAAGGGPGAIAARALRHAARSPPYRRSSATPARCSAARCRRTCLGRAWRADPSRRRPVRSCRAALQPPASVGVAGRGESRILPAWCVNWRSENSANCSAIDELPTGRRSKDVFEIAHRVGDSGLPGRLGRQADSRRS
jgi:hypothetical protein